jgi:hypothetical protein
MAKEKLEKSYDVAKKIFNIIIELVPSSDLESDKDFKLKLDKLKLEYIQEGNKRDIDVINAFIKLIIEADLSNKIKNKLIEDIRSLALK